MDKLNLPFEQEVEPGFTPIGAEPEPDRNLRLRRFLTDPLSQLGCLVVGFFALEAVRRSYCTAEAVTCGGDSPVYFLFVLATILGGGYLLWTAFDRYMHRRTQMIAAAILALPVAYLLAGHQGATTSEVLPPPPALIAEIGELREALVVNEAAREAQRKEISVLFAELEDQSARIEEQAVTITRQAAAIESQTAILGEQSERIDELSPERLEAIAERKALAAVAEGRETLRQQLALQESEILSEIEAREAREIALASVARRIAAAGPDPIQRRADPLPEIDVSRDIEILADYLSLDAGQRASLALDAEIQSCINVRKAERNAFAVMNHRVNPERYAEFLAECVEG